MAITLYTPPGISVPNGWTLVDMPDITAARQIEVRIIDSVGQTISPFTFQTQTQTWPGADRWEADVSLPPMARTSAARWIAWLAALRGSANVFRLGDPASWTPQGTALGSPRLNGVQGAMVTSISTGGWTANAQSVLQPGDMLQIGWRLHMVAGVAAINADASGNANIGIWPSLREAVTDTQPINLTNPTGLFRLAENTRSYSVNEALMFGISFKCVEAR